MSITRLNLQAYGLFTNKILDLSSGEQGLHLIWGPNEAGKSVALRGLTGALYGIPGRTTDNFLHGHNDLRVGLTLRHSDSTELAFMRRKGNKNTLLDESGEALDDDALEKFLGAVSQEIFQTMFGLDLSRLVSGGQDLAAGEGELGASLFSAGAGIGSLRQVLDGLEGAADELFRPISDRCKARY